MYLIMMKKKNLYNWVVLEDLWSVENDNLIDEVSKFCKLNFTELNEMYKSD